MTINASDLMDDKGSNKYRIKCPRSGCNSLIIRPGLTEFITVNEALQLYILPSRQLESFKKIFPSIPTEVLATDTESSASNVSAGLNEEGFWIFKDPFDFDNIGFSKPVPVPECHGIRFLSCADCDCAPLGLQDTEADKPFILLASNRVKYDCFDLYIVYKHFLDLCPFRLPTFNCSRLADTPRQLDLSEAELAQLQQTLADPQEAQSRYLNIASPFVKIYPSTIKILATFGDSISAGLFVSSSPLDLISSDKKYTLEQRGLSWSSGAESIEKIYTLFNTLSRLSASGELIGGSNGTTARLADTDNVHQVGLNLAVSSKLSSDLYLQFDKFKRIMDQHIEWQSIGGWKMISLFIGNNDLCKICEDSLSLTTMDQLLQSYESNIRHTLEQLKSYGATQEKTLVNLYGLLDINPLKNTAVGQVYCSLTRRLGNMCECILKASPEQLQSLNERRVGYNNVLAKLAREYQESYLKQLFERGGKNIDAGSFLVFYQPSFESLRIEDTGLSILSPVDCFHPNFCGHQAMAYSAFNSLFSGTYMDKFRHARNLGTASKFAILKTGDSKVFNEVAQKLTGNSLSASLGHDSGVDLGWICPDQNTFIQ